MRFISTAEGYHKKKSHGMLCSLNRTINEYAGASSAHGIKYIYEPDRWNLERLFWICVVGFAFVFRWNISRMYLDI